MFPRKVNYNTSVPYKLINKRPNDAEPIVVLICNMDFITRCLVSLFRIIIYRTKPGISINTTRRTNLLPQYKIQPN